MDIKAVLLDLDGVLYDSLPQYVEAWTAAFNKVELDIAKIDVYQLEGMPGRQTVIHLFQKYLNRLPFESEIELVLKVKAQTLLQFEHKIMPGAIELLNSIYNRKLPICIVTGSTKQRIKQQIANDFSPYLTEENVVNGDDVIKGKPNPEPYLTACQKLNINPYEALVIENSPLGITAATTAGCHCLAVNTGVLADHLLLEQGALTVFSNCFQLTNEWSNFIQP